MTNDTKPNEKNANKSDEKQKKNGRVSRLALDPDMVHLWLTEKVKEVYNFDFTVSDFKKNNGMTELLGHPQKKVDGEK